MIRQIPSILLQSSIEALSAPPACLLESVEALTLLLAGLLESMQLSPLIANPLESILFSRFPSSS